MAVPRIRKLSSAANAAAVAVDEAVEAAAQAAAAEATSAAERAALASERAALASERATEAAIQATQTMAEQTACMSRVEQWQKDFEGRLFNGNGAIPTLFKKHEELTQKVDDLKQNLNDNRTELGKEIDKVGTGLKVKFAWVGGSAATIGTVLGFTGKWLFTKLPLLFR